MKIYVVFGFPCFLLGTFFLFQRCFWFRFFLVSFFLGVLMFFGADDFLVPMFVLDSDKMHVPHMHVLKNTHSTCIHLIVPMSCIQKAHFFRNQVRIFLSLGFA